MGPGGKLLAMPWNVFEPSAPEGKLVLNVDKREFEPALIGTPRGRILLTVGGVLSPAGRAAASPVGNSGMVEEGVR